MLVRGRSVGGSSVWGVVSKGNFSGWLSYPYRVYFGMVGKRANK